MPFPPCFAGLEGSVAHPPEVIARKKKHKARWYRKKRPAPGLWALQVKVW